MENPASFGFLYIYRTTSFNYFYLIKLNSRSKHDPGYNPNLIDLTHPFSLARLSIFLLLSQPSSYLNRTAALSTAVPLVFQVSSFFKSTSSFLLSLSLSDSDSSSILLLFSLNLAGLWSLSSSAICNFLADQSRSFPLISYFHFCFVLLLWICAKFLANSFYVQKLCLGFWSDSYLGLGISFSGKFFDHPNPFVLSTIVIGEFVDMWFLWICESVIVTCELVLWSVNIAVKFWIMNYCY